MPPTKRPSIEEIVNAIAHLKKHAITQCENHPDRPFTFLRAINGESEQRYLCDECAGESSTNATD